MRHSNKKDKMVSKKHIKRLGFKTIDDYYKYIVDSLANGQFAQTRILVNALSIRQLLNMILYFEQYGYEKHSLFCIQAYKIN